MSLQGEVNEYVTLFEWKMGLVKMMPGLTWPRFEQKTVQM